MYLTFPAYATFSMPELCHILFPFRNAASEALQPPPTTGATINPPSPTPSLPTCSDPQVFATGFSPLLSVSAPTLRFPSLSPRHRLRRNLRVTASADAGDKHASTEQRANPLVPLTPPFSFHLPIFPQIHRFLLHLPPRFTAQFWTLHRRCSTAKISTQLSTEPCELCQLPLLPLLLPRHASACRGRGGTPMVVQRAFWRATSVLEVPASLTAASNSHCCALFLQLATLKSVLPVFAVNRHRESKPYRLNLR